MDTIKKIQTLITVGKLSLAICGLIIKDVPRDSPRQIILRRTLAWWERKAGLEAAQ